MPRYIIECDDPSYIILGMRAIKAAIRLQYPLHYEDFENGSFLVVKKTKTGYSARTAGKK